MEVARTSMVHAAAPHFLWPFAVRYADEQLNLWPCVSHPETSPTLRWTGEVGDASTFRFYHPGSRHVLSSHNITFHESVCFYHLHPHCSSPVPLPPLSLVDDPPPPVAPLPPLGPAPSGVSQVDPPPLVEPLEVSSDTSGPAEGGDPTPAATMTPRRCTRLAVPPGFQPRPSSPPLQPVAVDSGAAGGGTTGGAVSGGAGYGGAECTLGTGGIGGIGAGGPATRRQENLSPERLREWAVQWGRLGGGASRARSPRAGGTGGAAAVGTAEGSPGGGAGRAGAAGIGGTCAAGGAGGAGSRGASPGGAGAGVHGTRGTGAAGGAGGSRGASPGGASAGVLGTGGTGAAGGAGGSRGASPGGASAGVLGTGGTRAAGGAGTAGGDGGATGGTAGGTGVTGAFRQESLSPLQLREWAARWGNPGGGAGGTGSRGVVATGARGSGGATTQPQSSALRRLLNLPPAATEFSLLPGSPLPTPATHTEVTASLTARREPETRASTLECQEPETRDSVPARVCRPRAPAVPGTHDMTLCPSSVPRRVFLPSPPASSLPHIPDPESDLVRAASPNVTHLLATVVTDPSFESAAASALVTELVDFAALCCLDYAASLVFYSSCPPSVWGELSLGCDVLEDMQFELERLAATALHLASMLLCPEGDPDALDIPTPRTYAEAITGPYSSQWLIAMDAEMASWKSTSTYIDEVPPLGANIVDGMWIFRVKRPPGSPPAFKARYVARGFSQREGVDFFQTFSPTPKMTSRAAHSRAGSSRAARARGRRPAGLRAAGWAAAGRRKQQGGMGSRAPASRAARSRAGSSMAARGCKGRRAGCKGRRAGCKGRRGGLQKGGARAAKGNSADSRAARG
ncbi:unnamed protein product [Closterium sp. NIES-54]